MEELHKETFSACLHEAFHVERGDAPGFELRLTEVSGNFSTARQEVFSLVFSGPLEEFIQQGIHRLHNDRLGTLELFLVPIGRDAAGYQYEAVFNRLIPAA